MTAADHARITAYRAARVTHLGPRSVRVFAGWPVRFNGVDAVLQGSNRGDLRYYFAQRVDCGTAERLGSKENPNPPLPHHFLVELIVRALGEGRLLPQVVRLQRTEIDELDSEITALQGDLDLLRTRNAETRVAFAHPRATDALKRDLNLEYNTREAQIAQSEAKLAAASHRHGRKQAAARAAQHDGVQDANLEHLVAALADPRSVVAKALLEGALSLDVRSSQMTEPGRPPDTVLTVKGTLLVHNDTGTWRVPLHGAYVVGARTQVDDRVATAVDGLRRGRPLPQTLLSDWRRWLPLVRDALGLDRDPFRFGGADDPHLLALDMAVIYPPAADPGPDPTRPRLAGPPLQYHQLPAAARRLGEPLPLLQRIWREFTRAATRPRYLFDNSTVAATAFQRAARTGTVRFAVLPSPMQARSILMAGPFADEWVFGHGTATLTPCSGCGGTRRVPLRLREATGSVCRSCRTDRAEVAWDAAYDRYRHRDTR